MDNNLLLSEVSLWDMSEGGAYVHNLMTGEVRCMPEPTRDTPYHPAHSTEVVTTVTTKGFTGPSCREASKFIEQALGQRTSELLTAEFHQVEAVGQQQQQPA